MSDGAWERSLQVRYGSRLPRRARFGGPAVGKSARRAVPLAAPPRAPQRGRNAAELVEDGRPAPPVGVLASCLDGSGGLSPQAGVIGLHRGQDPAGADVERQRYGHAVKRGARGRAFEQVDVNEVVSEDGADQGSIDFTAPRSQHPPGGVCGTRLGSWYWAFDRDEEADVGAGVQPSLRVMAPVRRGEAMQPLGPLTLHLEAGIVAAYRPVRAQGDWKTFAAGAGAPHGEARAGKGGRKQGASMVVRRSFGAGRKRWARLGRYSSRARGHPRQPTASRNGVQEGSSSSPGARSAGRSGEASGPSDR